MTGRLIEAVAIGASAGAVQALLRILPALPPDYPLAVLIVVHVPPGRDNALVGLLAERCRIAVKEAEDKEPLRPGTVYLAPSDYHLLVEADRTLALSTDELVHHSRPSVDVLLESCADAFGPAVAGVVLTGANEDGAAGLKAIAEAGGLVAVEAPDSAFAATMPAAALAACGSARVLTLDAITTLLLDLGGSA